MQIFEDFFKKKVTFGKKIFKMVKNNEQYYIILFNYKLESMILGIDPGIKKLGYALIQPDLKIVDAGILKMEEKKFDRVEQYHRMLEIHDFFYELIKNNKVEKLVMERYFITDFNKKNAEFLYGMRGVVMTLALKNGIQIYEYTPQELKKNITGNPKADKETVQRFITKIYKLEDIPEFHDAADALGFAFLGTRK